MSSKPPDDTTGLESATRSPKKKVRPHVPGLETSTKPPKKKPRPATTKSWNSKAQGLKKSPLSRKTPIPINAIPISEYQTSIKPHASQKGQESFVVTDDRMMEIINRQKLPVLGYIVGARTMAIAQKSVLSDVKINMDGEDSQIGSSISSSSNQFTLPMTLKSWSCTQCNKMFRSRSEYQRHVRVHTGERPFLCGICSAKFKQKSHLKVHLKAHYKQNEALNKMAETNLAQSTFEYSQLGNQRPNLQEIKSTYDYLRSSIPQEPQYHRPEPLSRQNPYAALLPSGKNYAIMSAFKVGQGQLRHLQYRSAHHNNTGQDSHHHLHMEPIQTFSQSHPNTDGRRQMGNELPQKGVSSLSAFQTFSTYNPGIGTNTRSGELKIGNRTSRSPGSISLDRQGTSMQNQGLSEAELFQSMTAEQDKFKSWGSSYRSNE
mmetsp:Transcript_35042/g.48996  ORF Transcript_35042/g.48996 Transcript_35042/m.48996 type:complete len:431 (-) Transcript_35042:255-1547(-)